MQIQRNLLFTTSFFAAVNWSFENDIPPPYNNLFQALHRYIKTSNQLLFQEYTYAAGNTIQLKLILNTIPFTLSSKVHHSFKIIHNSVEFLIRCYSRMTNFWADHKPKSSSCFQNNIYSKWPWNQLLPEKYVYALLKRFSFFQNNMKPLSIQEIHFLCVQKLVILPK